MVLFLSPFSQTAASSVLFSCEVSSAEQEQSFLAHRFLRPPFSSFCLFLKIICPSHPSLAFKPFQKIDSRLSKYLSSTHFKNSDQQRSTETGHPLLSFPSLWSRNRSTSSSPLLHTNSRLHQGPNSCLHSVIPLHLTPKDF